MAERRQARCRRRRATTMGTTFLQATVPDYRVPLVEALRGRLDGGLTVVCGDDDFSPSVTLSRDLMDHVRVRNVWLAGRRLLWQRSTVRELSRPRTLMLELNPRMLNAWPILVTRRLRGRRSVLFGHAWPRSGRHSRSDTVRQLMRRLSDGIVVYTESQALELSQRMPGHDIYAAPNALYPRALAPSSPARRRGRDVISVGRLVAAKKPGLLLEAFAHSADMLPRDARLVFVGDGPMRRSLETQSRTLGIASRVDFTGHVADFERLRNLYDGALVSVCAGEAGLSLTQSLWFGVPVVLGRDDAHGPEIEAAVPDWNALFFASDSASGLQSRLLEIFAAREEWLERAPEISNHCADRYSLEAMVEAIVKALEG